MVVVINLYLINIQMYDSSMTSTQCKMARAALGWSVHKLAAVSGISANTISRFERGNGALTRTVERLQAAMLDTGQVSFEAPNCVCAFIDS